MKQPLHLIVLGDPKGQPRPRAFSRGGMTRVYDPGTAEAWKSQIAIAFKDAKPADFTPFEGPVNLNIHFFFTRPKSHFNRHGLKPDAPRFVTKKPDADNAAKAVMDALTTLGVWRDDAQVGILSVSKRYTDTPQAGAKIGINELEF